MENILSGFLFIVAHIMVIGQISTTDFTPPDSGQWSPVIKMKNTTRDWKVLHKGQKSSPVDRDLASSSSSSADEDQEQASATVRRFTSPVVETPGHAEKADPRYRPYYDEPSSSIPHLIPRYEPAADADGYYFPSYAPPGRPIYGLPPPPTPSPTPLPEGSVYIELALDTMVIRCVAHDPLEHIVWTRYACPNDYYYGTGTVVAEGSVVTNADLYGVHIVGDNGEIASELKLKTPLDDGSSGLYVCEAWPHYMKPSDGYGHYYPPAYPSATDVFIIGGTDLLDQCSFGPKSPHPHRPFLYKNRHDDAGDKHHDDKILTKKQSNKSAAIDPMRKPRNLAKPATGGGKQNSIADELQKTNATGSTKADRKNRRRPTPLYKTDERQRYDFKFDNSTEVLNASAADVFKHLGWRAANKSETLSRKAPFNAVESSSKADRHNRTVPTAHTDLSVAAYQRASAVNESQINSRLNWKFLNNSNDKHTTNTSVARN